MQETVDLTVLLTKVAQGDSDAENSLIRLAYPHLRKLAAGMMRRERPDHTLQPSALVNEVYVRLKANLQIDWKGRSHFYAVSAQLMRHILVDHARSKIAGKRGGAGRQQVSLDMFPVYDSGSQPETVIAIDECLQRLAEVDQRKAKVVEMRFFGGLTEEEIATALDVSARTVKRDWITARAWLHSELCQVAK